MTFIPLLARYKPTACSTFLNSYVLSFRLGVFLGTHKLAPKKPQLTHVMSCDWWKSTKKTTTRHMSEL